jgi:hypothetical protein
MTVSTAIQTSHPSPFNIIAIPHSCLSISSFNPPFHTPNTNPRTESPPTNFKMQYFTASTMLLALLPAFTLGAPTLAVRQVSVSDLSDALNQWSADTSLVSEFLSAATSLSSQDLASQAAIALNNENDELSHKAVFDAMFVNVAIPDSNVVAANTVLVTQQTFQFVVDGLTDLMTNGATYTPDQVAFSINEINTDRCNLVLPAIDAYFQAANAVIQDGATVLATRPNNCP